MQRFTLFAGALCALALTACGGGGSTTSAPATSAPTASPTSTPPASTSIPGLPALASAGGASVYTSTTAGATDGFTLYVLSNDTTTSIACTVASGCTGVWPPYTATAADQSAMLLRHIDAEHTESLPAGFTVFTRPDDSGALQWAFNGHPLYLYSGDSAAGQANGEGATSFGGTWTYAQAVVGATPSPAPTQTPYVAQAVRR